MAKRRTNPIEELRETIREGLEAAVEVIGFAGVLDLLADEASERSEADPEDARAEIILNAIETAIEEITELEAEDEDEEEETDGDEEDDEEIGDEETGEEGV